MSWLGPGVRLLKCTHATMHGMITSHEGYEIACCQSARDEQMKMQWQACLSLLAQQSMHSASDEGTGG